MEHWRDGEGNARAGGRSDNYFTSENNIFFERKFGAMRLTLQKQYKPNQSVAHYQLKQNTGAITPHKIMKKNLKKANRSNPSLGELILAVSSVSRNNREAIAAVADLLESGRVCLNSNGRKIRAQVY